jgi:PEP-CTERM motif
MNTAKSALKISALASVLLTASVASYAAPILYFGEDIGDGENSVIASPNSDAQQAAFLAALINPGVETFEGMATGVPGVVNFAGAGVTATLSGGTVISQADGTTNGFGRYGVTDDPDENENFLETAGGTNAFTLTFSNPIAAFGFYGIDIGDFNGQVTVTTVGGLNQLFNVGNSINTTGGGILFWGVISTSVAELFSSVTFGNTGSGDDFFAFDDFTVGSFEQVREVPEPESMLLFSMGLGLLGMGRLAKRSKTS